MKVAVEKMLAIKHGTVVGLKSVQACKRIAFIIEDKYIQHKSTVHLCNNRIKVRACNSEKLLQQIPTKATLAYSCGYSKMAINAGNKRSKRSISPIVKKYKMQYI